MHLGTQTADVHAADVVDSRKRIKAISASSSGNLVEWYDFYVYSFGALYFASAFFPKGDQTTQLLSAASVFAVGFLMRPVGSWIFGRLADRKGRKTSMVTSVLIMCAGSLLVAIMPTYNSIGVWAPALLTLARMLPGVSVGGEYGTSATYMSEVALAKHRGFLASFQYVTLIGGQLLALLVLLVLQSVMTRDEISAWGWRIPFFIGALAALVAFYLRSGLHETANASMLHMNKKDGHRQGIAGLTLAALGIVYGIGTSPLYAMKETFNALAVKHQLQVLDRSRRRAPRLTPWDRLVLGLCICCIPIKRLAKCAVILKPSSLTRLHHDYRLAAVAD